MDGGPDPLVGAAAADVRHGGVDVGVAGAAVLGEQRRGGHDLTRLAVTALGHVIGDQARCTAWLRLGDSPSIVVTRFPAAAATGITHDRTAVPSRCTVQAPHCAMPHPNFVPVRPRLSRSTHRSGVSGATSTDWRLPLTVKTIGGMTHSGRRVSRKLVLGRGRGKGEGGRAGRRYKSITTRP